jgi:hypothetical protein
MTVAQVGAWTLALSSLLEHGGISLTDLPKVCKTTDEEVLDAVRARLVIVGSNGSSMLTHAETLKRRQKLGAIINARADAGARAGWMGGVEKKEDVRKGELNTPSSNIEVVIEQRIARFRAALDEEGLAFVLKVMDALGRTKRGRMLPVSTRLEQWDEASKFPPEQFAYACYQFAVNGPLATGKGFRYLLGIVNGSALSWYVEQRAEMEKRTGFRLECEV